MNLADERIGEVGFGRGEESTEITEKVSAVLQNEVMSLTDLEGRLDSEAHLLAQGARAGDRIEWSSTFAARVTDAAARSARLMAWDPYGLTDMEGVEWTLRTLTRLVRTHLEDQEIPEHLAGRDAISISNDSITSIATRAALEWEKHRVSWIPEAVTEIVYAALTDTAERHHALDIARSIRNQRTAARAGDQKPTRAQVLAQSITLRQQIANAEQLRRLNEANARHAAEVARQQLVKAEARAREQEKRALDEAVRARNIAEAHAREEDLRAREEAELRERWRTRPAPAPDPQPFGVSHDGAESLCAAWMRHLGVLDAEVTRFVGDGGIDINSNMFLAQVKNYVGSVAVADVRALFGVAAADGKKAILFTSGTITTEGLLFADRTGIALLGYDAVAGTLSGLNVIGQQCVELSIVDAMSGEGSS